MPSSFIYFGADSYVDDDDDDDDDGGDAKLRAELI